jgi:hypothetical protein
MEIVRATDNHDNAETRDTLLMFGGIALMMLGAGLVLTTPTVRRFLGGVSVGNLLQTAAPDFERYLKLKAM